MATDEWLVKWHANKDLLVPLSNLNEYFTQSEIAGKAIDLLQMGVSSFPTGKVIVRDPLYYFDDDEQPFIQTIPAGTYPVSACVVKPTDDHCARFAAVKLTITPSEAVRFEEGLCGHENLDDCGVGSYFGFNVDAGLATIADVETRDAFNRYFERWQQENPGKNNYDDYFDALFAESYNNHPLYQRKGGDWINWTVPGTDLHMPMFPSGFGDGCYPVYFGYDANDEVCCIIIEFIDIRMAYSPDESNEGNED